MSKCVPLRIYSSQQPLVWRFRVISVCLPTYCVPKYIPALLLQFCSTVRGSTCTHSIIVVGFDKCARRNKSSPCNVSRTWKAHITQSLSSGYPRTCCDSFTLSLYIAEFQRIHKFLDLCCFTCCVHTFLSRVSPQLISIRLWRHRFPAKQ